MISLSQDELERRAKDLQLLILDVDGVLTGGELILGGKHTEIKQFHFHDGLGVMLLRSAGIKVAFMSDRHSPALERRAQEMSVDEISPVVAGNKEESLNNLLGKLSLQPEQVGYIGDDLRDVPPMKLVALPISVANSRPEVKQNSVHITAMAGGQGAVREAAEWILELRGQKDELIAPLIQTAAERAAAKNDQR
jgi:3-deoxy-D-manno-octulosonate 8-phosphate phosphatase (KDO 8-P phosphatase)